MALNDCYAAKLIFHSSLHILLGSREEDINIYNVFYMVQECYG